MAPGRCGGKDVFATSTSTRLYDRGAHRLTGAYSSHVDTSRISKPGFGSEADRV
jgi:hypothetical protein